MSRAKTAAIRSQTWMLMRATGTRNFIATWAPKYMAAAGYEIIVPQANLCCGRPLYDFGMLDRAESLLLNILDALAPEIKAGIPVVGLII